MTLVAPVLSAVGGGANGASYLAQPTSGPSTWPAVAFVAILLILAAVTAIVVARRR